MIIKIKEGKFAFCKKNGKILIEYQESLSDLIKLIDFFGLSKTFFLKDGDEEVIIFKKDNGYGLIYDNNIILEGCSEISVFNKDLGIYQFKKKRKKRMGFIHFDSLEILEFSQIVKEYSKNCIQYRDEKTFGVIDIEEFEIICNFEEIDTFGNECFKFKENGKYGVIDSSGFVYSRDMRFDEIDIVSSGVAKFKIGRKYGLLHIEGYEIIIEDCDEIKIKNEKIDIIAEVKKNGKQFEINLLSFSSFDESDINEDHDEYYEIEEEFSYNYLEHEEDEFNEIESEDEWEKQSFGSDDDEEEY